MAFTTDPIKETQAERIDLKELKEQNKEFIEAAERELFISLCGNQKTQERISYMLKNGKPRRTK